MVKRTIFVQQGHALALKEMGPGAADDLPDRAHDRLRFLPSPFAYWRQIWTRVERLNRNSGGGPNHRYRSRTAVFSALVTQGTSMMNPAVPGALMDTILDVPVSDPRCSCPQS